MEDPVLQISLKFQRNSKQAYDCTRLMIVQAYLFRECRLGVYGCHVNCQCLILLSQHLYLSPSL
jgi:hypothetical protein